MPASHDERGHAIDLYVASGLNARIGNDELGAIRAVALEAFEALAQVPATITSWALPRADLLDPPERSDSWFVHRAWWLMSGAPAIKLARAHKVLHHKRPTLVPLVDNETYEPLKAAAVLAGHGNTWVQIQDDLTQHESGFSELEAWFNSLPGRRLPLQRLRLHDILLWCATTGSRLEAQEQGKEVPRILDGTVGSAVVGFPVPPG